MIIEKIMILYLGKMIYVRLMYLMWAKPSNGLYLTLSIE